MTNELINLKSITKRFGRKKVLDQINLTINRGQSIALLGINGSGKSTLLRIICGLTKFSSGKIKYTKGIKFNYIPEHFPRMNITVTQYIKHMGLIEKIKRKVIKERFKELVNVFQMENMLDVPMKYLSKGTLQKVAVIQALLKKPDVLLLDEPLSGQDIQSQKEFIKIIKKLKQQGVAIIMSCHEMFLVNQISDLAYEIKNHRLEPALIMNEKDYDFLIFENSSQDNHDYSKIADRVEKIDYDQHVTKLVVLREKSNEIIMQMIQEGFELRVMKGNDE